MQRLEVERQRAYTTLTEQMKHLSTSHDQLQRETRNLVTALRSPQTRGRWGELQLRRVVEMAGMLERCDFDEQVTSDSDTGRMRPDMVVHLPGGKNVVVDAKVPMQAFLDANEADDESLRRSYLASHGRQMKAHVAALSKKEYWKRVEPSPEFVVAFIPGDPLLTAAIAGQFVNGMEGKDRNGNLLPAGGGYLKTITTLKHFAANNSEINRRTGSADMDDRTLREYYTAQFRRIVQQAHPGSIMSSYNSINGTPAAANVYLMDRLMRQTFGFTGYFTSDCDAIFEMVRSHHWQPPNLTRPINNTEQCEAACVRSASGPLCASLLLGVDHAVSAGRNNESSTYEDTFSRSSNSRATSRTLMLRLWDSPTSLANASSGSQPCTAIRAPLAMSMSEREMSACSSWVTVSRECCQRPALLIA